MPKKPPAVRFEKPTAWKRPSRDADVVYPKSWALFAAMEKRTAMYGKGDMDGTRALEKELLDQNSEFKDWECTEERMKKTRGGNGPLHALFAGRHYRCELP